MDLVFVPIVIHFTEFLNKVTGKEYCPWPYETCTTETPKEKDSQDNNIIEADVCHRAVNWVHHDCVVDFCPNLKKDKHCKPRIKVVNIRYGYIFDLILQYWLYSNWWLYKMGTKFLSSPGWRIIRYYHRRFYHNLYTVYYIISKRVESHTPVPSCGGFSPIPPQE